MRDPDLLASLHLHWTECALCERSDIALSLHHISRHPRDDVEGNLIMLCGDGVQGCHGMIEAHHPIKKLELSFFLRDCRPDVMAYLDQRYPREGADNWLRRQLGA